MLRRTALLLLMLTICSWVVPSALSAADKNSSDYWIEKLATYYTESAPYTLVYAMEMAMDQQGTKLAIIASGDILYAGADRMRTNIDMEMSMDLLPEPMKMSMTMVHDGEFIWTEMDNPMAGGKQVMKMSAEAAKDMQAQAGFGGGFSSEQLDPAAQAKMLAEMMDLAVTSIEGGTVRLEGAMTEEFKEKMGAGAAIFGENGMGKVILTLDEKTGAMRKMVMGDVANPLITMNYEDMKLIPAGDLPADAFSYTPPDGVQVQDMSQMMKDAENAAGAGSAPMQ